jgi:hypothetical protein
MGLLMIYLKKRGQDKEIGRDPQKSKDVYIVEVAWRTKPPKGNEMGGQGGTGEKEWNMYFPSTS